jgi:hypothetical protein
MRICSVDLWLDTFGHRPNATSENQWQPEFMITNMKRNLIQTCLLAAALLAIDARATMRIL